MENGGWYRVDIPGTELSVLSLDTLYYNSRDTLPAESTGNEQLVWLRKQMAESDEDHKFIIVEHIYETASYWFGAWDNWKEDKDWNEYVDILQTYRDKVVFEATGHDHLMSIRYSRVAESDSSSPTALNKVLFPAVSSTSRTNPGFSTFIYDTESGQAENLKSTFIQLSKTYGLPETTQNSELPFFEVDFSAKYGLANLSGDAIEALVESLSTD